MAESSDRERGLLFEDVPELYDRVRPGYPPELFADLVEVVGLTGNSSIVEVGCGTGQATRPLANLGCRVSAIEPGTGLATLARKRLAEFSNVEIQVSSFEAWNNRQTRFDLLVAASSWHWIDPSIGWQKAHAVLKPDGWMAVLGNVVIRQPGESELYEETARLHQLFAPDNPDWGHPPTEDEVRATSKGWGPPNEDLGGFFGPTTVRWYPAVQHFDGAGMADHLRSLSPYRRLDAGPREELLDAIADYVRTQMADRISRHYLSVLRTAQRFNR